MARPHGGIGIVRRQFESDFLRYCEVNDFRPGFECARLMDLATERNDTRSFVQLSLIFFKSTGDSPVEQEQPELFVVDRRLAVSSN